MATLLFLNAAHHLQLKHETAMEVCVMESTRAKAADGIQLMISSVYEEYCADCMRETEHEFLLSYLVQCKACFRLIRVKKPVLAGMAQGVGARA
jgi:hypothetical protein